MHFLEFLVHLRHLTFYPFLYLSDHRLDLRHPLGVHLYRVLDLKYPRELCECFSFKFELMHECGRYEVETLHVADLRVVIGNGQEDPFEHKRRM
jgi:hypothetical protein